MRPEKADIQRILGEDFERYMIPVTLQLRESVLKAVIDDMELPEGSVGLDAGCGIGLQTFQLAEAVGAEGYVTGLDISEKELEYARKITDELSCSDRVEFKAGDVHRLPFEDDTFDWSWSADCIGYGPFKTLPLINELKRVVRPGGKIALLAWSSETLLPGYPDLEARLRTTTSGLAPFSKNNGPESHFLRTLGWYRAAGLVEPRVKTFVNEVHAPLSDDEKTAISQLLGMRWYNLDKELSKEEISLHQDLCSPTSKNFIANHPDYYAFFTYSLFVGTVPKK